jgi:hypothetical protein
MHSPLAARRRARPKAKPGQGPGNYPKMIQITLTLPEPEDAESRQSAWAGCGTPVPSLPYQQIPGCANSMQTSSPARGVHPLFMSATPVAIDARVSSIWCRLADNWYAVVASSADR